MNYVSTIFLVKTILTKCSALPVDYKLLEYFSSLVTCFSINVTTIEAANQQRNFDD